MSGLEVENLTSELREQLHVSSGTQGVAVSQVDPNSAAAAGGVQQGDVIEEVNHHPVTNVSEFEQAMHGASGQTMLLHVVRGGTGTLSRNRAEVAFYLLGGLWKPPGRCFAAVLRPNSLQECLTGQTTRMLTATAIAPSTLLMIEKKEMIRALHEEHEFSDRFISYMLSRNIRVEENLVDQLLNSTEKRLARALLLLARYGKENRPEEVVLKVSQEILAEMIGATRSRVSFFMNKFKNLGFIRYSDGLHVNGSLLSVVLHD